MTENLVKGAYCRLRYRGTTATTEIVRFAGETETQYKIQFQLSGKWCEALYSKSKWEIFATEVPDTLQRAFQMRESIQSARDRDERDRG